MANTAQARKRVRQAEKHRELNMGQRSRMRTFVKRVIAAIRAGDKATAANAYREMTSIIDKMAGKGLVHANKAARHKSRLNARIKAMA